MIERVRVLGAGGRVGSAVSARLAERGVRLNGDPELVLLCVPDRVIPEVAAELAVGPWIAHVSGATPLAALGPHERRFGMHPLQTFARTRGAEQLDGAWAAVTAESEEARLVGFELAELLGLRPFELDDANRVAYHAGAAIASNYLVTLRQRGRVAPRRGRRAARGARPAPARCHRRRLRADRPDRARRLGDRRAPPRRHPRGAPGARGALPRPRARDSGDRRPRAAKLQLVTRDRERPVNVCRTISEVRAELRAAAHRGLGRARADDGLAPRRPPLAAARGPRGVRRGRHEPVREPGPVLGRRRPRRLPARRGARPRARRGSWCRRRLRSGASRRCTRPASRPGSR